MANRRIVSISQEMILDEILSNDLIDVVTCKVCGRRKLFKVKGTVKPIYIEVDRATGELKYLLREWRVPGICNNCLRESIRELIEEMIYEAPLIPFKTIKINDKFAIVVGNRKMFEHGNLSELEVFLYGLEERLLRLTTMLIENFKTYHKFEDRINAVKLGKYYWDKVLLIKILKSVIDEDITSKNNVENAEELISYFAFTEGLEYKHAVENYDKRGIIVNLKWDKAVINNEALGLFLGKINGVRGKFTKKGNYVTKCCVYRDVNRWFNVFQGGKLGVSLKYGRRYPILVLRHKIGSMAWVPVKIKK